MNLFASAPAWLAWILAALLVAAAAEDAVRLRISNILGFAVLAGALVAMSVSGLQTSLWQNALVFAALLTVGTLLFAGGKMGGGDVKLIAALGLWCDFHTALIMLSSIMISGGVLAVVILAGRLFAPAAAAARVVVLRPGGGIPYGVAIAAGALLVLVLQRG
jgi:prepilin peptidase CpaA